MIVRIDLLNDSERRHQGPVSTRFAVRAGAGTVLALLLIGAGIVYLNGREVRRELKNHRARWADLEPRFKAFGRLRERHAEVDRYLRELEGWRAVRIRWDEALRDLAGVVPPEIQLVRMEVRDDVAAPRAGREDQPVQPYRTLRVRFNGRAAGDRAEDLVSRLIMDFRAIGDGDPLFNAIALLGIQADVSAGRNLSSFELDASGTERLLKGP